MHHSEVFLAGTAMIFVAWSASAVPPAKDPAQPTFILSSTDFKDGGIMPSKLGNKNPDGFGCTGANLSPQLSWTKAPQDTKSFAVLITGVEGQGGLGESHFVGYGISPNVTSFEEGELSQPSDKFVGGRNIHGVGIYNGPCVHPGLRRHYIIEVIATDLDPKALDADLTLADLQAKLKGGHAKASAALVGDFGEP